MLKTFTKPRGLRKRAEGRLARLFGRPASRMMVFLAAVALFVWPFLASWHQWYGRGLYLYLFAAWALVIAMILVLGVCQNDDTPDRDQG